MNTSGAATAATDVTARKPRGTAAIQRPATLIAPPLPTRHLPRTAHPAQRRDEYLRWI
ncbi:MAG TPA: hypothetical protein VGY98_09320 [Verrucomicrobiae bacterium]|nr:hypothetical protein [Verrucomicrobiae bacterium]